MTVVQNRPLEMTACSKNSGLEGAMVVPPLPKSRPVIPSGRDLVGDAVLMLSDRPKAIGLTMLDEMSLAPDKIRRRVLKLTDRCRLVLLLLLLVVSVFRLVLLGHLPHLLRPFPFRRDGRSGRRRGPWRAAGDPSIWRCCFDLRVPRAHGHGDRPPLFLPTLYLRTLVLCTDLTDHTPSASKGVFD